MSSVSIPFGCYGHKHTMDLDKGLDCFAWPGGYPIVYYTDDGTCLCGDCATKQLRANAEPDAIVCSGERIVAADVLEGSAIDHGIVNCEDCGRLIVDLDHDWEWQCADCGAVNDNDTEVCACGAQKVDYHG